MIIRNKLKINLEFEIRYESYSDWMALSSNQRVKIFEFLLELYRISPIDRRTRNFWYARKRQLGILSK